MSEKQITTNSMWAMFRNCRRKCYWRHQRELISKAPKSHTLFLGTVAHKALEWWYLPWVDTKKLHDGTIQGLIDRCYPDRGIDADQKANWHIASAMMQAYLQRYGMDLDWNILAVEPKFEHDIRNPETGALSRSFKIAGKGDLVIENRNGIWLVEHKTASTIDGNYLERLWLDFQITLYAHHLSLELDKPFAGVIYNIIGKPRLRQGMGETQEEYETRKATLEAKSKTGKSSTAKRKEPESDEHFQARLAERYENDSAFHREMIYISPGRINNLQAELWELTQNYLDAQRRDMWYQNERICFDFQRPCEYLPLCRAKDPELVIEQLYEHEAPNRELREDKNHIPVF